jgi:hypothetical protein
MRVPSGSLVTISVSRPPCATIGPARSGAPSALQSRDHPGDIAGLDRQHRLPGGEPVAARLAEARGCRRRSPPTADPRRHVPLARKRPLAIEDDEARALMGFRPQQYRFSGREMSPSKRTE